MKLKVTFRENLQNFFTNFGESQQSFSANFGEIQKVTEDSPLEPYDGEYEVTPSKSDQILATKNKSMIMDLTVKRVPFYETSNTQGGTTIYIGE